MQERRLVGDLSEVGGQRGRDAVQLELGAPDVGRHLHQTGVLKGGEDTFFTT